MEDFIYYFYNYKVETATVEINLPGWQKLTDDEIEIYKSGNYKSIEMIDDLYCFSNTIENPSFNLDELKQSKVELLSSQSFDRAEDYMPKYKYENCLISKSLVERGKAPIYPNYLEIMRLYEESRVSLRLRFYECKSLVEAATSVEEIDKIEL